MSELHIPPEVSHAMRALRPELRKKLSLRDIDDMTRPFRTRIAELEAERDQANAEKVKAIGEYGLMLQQRDEARRWVHDLQSGMYIPRCWAGITKTIK